MTAVQLFNKAEQYMRNEAIPEDVRKFIGLLVEGWHGDRMARSNSKQVLDMLRKSLENYQVWHKPEEVPGRTTDLLVKRKIDHRGPGTNEYKKASYRYGTFIVDGKPSEIASWTFMATSNKK